MKLVKVFLAFNDSHFLKILGTMMFRLLIFERYEPYTTIRNAS